MACTPCNINKPTIKRTGFGGCATGEEYTSKILFPDSPSESLTPISSMDASCSIAPLVVIKTNSAGSYRFFEKTLCNLLFLSIQN
jgi:hypothetical protein